MHVDRSPSVVVAGGGPVGLMLAAELMLAGTDVVVVERRTSQALESSRAGGLHPRTLEVLDQNQDLSHVCCLSCRPGLR